MHPAIARFVPQSASNTMSSIASNLATLARSKLRSAHAGSGSRDNLSLHRWVLLKNSITTTDVHSDLATRSVTSVSADASGSPNETDPDTDLEDEEVDSIIDEGMFAFLFPDPWDAVAPSEEGSASEEQWLDSLLQSLGDDDDEEDAVTDVKVHVASVDAEKLNDHSRADSRSICSSCSEEFATPSLSPISVPYPVPYPPFHAPLEPPFEIDSHDCCFASDSSPYSRFDHHDIDDPEGSVPDAIEDTSDDESESLSTPFSRSRVSLSLVDPASVPLPSDRYEPQIYRGSSDLFPYEDPLPYSDLPSETPAVYSPYHQGC